MPVNWEVKRTANLKTLDGLTLTLKRTVGCTTANELMSVTNYYSIITFNLTFGAIETKVKLASLFLCSYQKYSIKYFPLTQYTHE